MQRCRHIINSFDVIAKIAIDRSQVDEHALVEEISEAIRDEFAHYNYSGLQPISAEENMEGKDVVDIVHFPAVNIQGTTEYAALVELWSSSDDYYLKRLSPKFGVNAPWAISVYTVSAASLQMLSVAHPELNPAGYEDQFTDYIVVAALNPMAVSKVGYTDLPRFHNIMFNNHCSRIKSKIKSGVSNALYYKTDLDWDMAGQSYGWWWNAPSFDVNDLLAGVDITNNDIAALPQDITMPSVTVPNASAEDVAAALKGYMQATMPMYKTGGPMAMFNGLVREFMGELFAWSGQTPFDQSYDNPMYDPNNPATGGPLIDVYFEDVADMKTQLPTLLNMFFVPMWTGQNPAGMPLMTQGWKFPRAFALGQNDEVQIIELCTAFYAQMALGTGMHHTPAMPCMAAVYQDGDDAVAQMFTAKAINMGLAPP
ncbi:MAG: hypothetical protein B6I36_10785 [Desulfobacteraceae bacterium 4572_35.1]|nr:MAG: hypothetical protein B6I36_10785 [Desulfobacteraceae bacterium 4572_35.1]